MHRPALWVEHPVLSLPAHEAQPHQVAEVRGDLCLADERHFTGKFRIDDRYEVCSHAGTEVVKCRTDLLGPMMAVSDVHF